ncbi:hypothetical protein CHELA1G11_12022 [Hyphomicrobiales bacterium]|nr:hypothetical protein CHELA1G11_12022 [Hyphomicrobiales bacterium]CAH1663836.1 hypothetical protein CHELA1G2_12290 [Hyphomicrobiales bacterium]
MRAITAGRVMAEDPHIAAYFGRLNRALNAISDLGYRATHIHHELERWEQNRKDLQRWSDNGEDGENPVWPGATQEDVSEIIGGIYSRLLSLRTNILSRIWRLELN